MSATEYLIDASTRHQIMLQRLSGGAFNKLKPILEQLQKDVKARLRDNPTDFQMHRLTTFSDYCRTCHENRVRRTQTFYR